MNAILAVRRLVALAAISLASSAWATLGETAATIPGDEKALAATRGPANVRERYQVERLVSASRTVREYVAPSGVVFAVSWNGVSHPDLGVLLGAYATPVRRVLDRQRASPGRRSRRVEAGGVVVETWGHMRALHGRAWVPALLPAGVTLDEIQ